MIKVNTHHLTIRNSPSPGETLGHLLIYGMGPGKLADTLGIDIYEAKDLMNKYFKTFPKIKKTLDKLEKEAKAKKYAFSPLDKRRRDLSTIDWDHPGKVAHAMNIAKNMPFQGAGATIMKLALCKVRTALKEEQLDAKIVNVVHDELLVEVHKDHAKRAAEIVQEKMISAFNVLAPTLPMVVKPEIGEGWIH